MVRKKISTRKKKKINNKVTDKSVLEEIILQKFENWTSGINLAELLKKLKED